MTISENLLFQMYSVMENTKLPELTVSEGDKAGSKSSFQDLMDQTRKDVSNAQKPEAPKKDSSQPEKTEQAEKPEGGEEAEQPKLENTNYCAAAYLFRPEILPVPEEAAAPVAQAPVTLVVEQLPTAADAQTLPQPELISAQAQPQQADQPQQETPVFLPSSQASVETTPQTTVAAPQAEVPPQYKENTQSEAAFTQTQSQSQDNETELAPQITNLQQPLFREVETAPVKVGETYELDTTSPEMDVDLAETIRTAANEGVQKLEIQLNPQNLGKIVVELTQSTDGTLQVVLHTANAKSSGLLSQHLDSLNAALQNLGQQAQVHVEVARNQDSSSAQQHPFQQADPDGHGQQQQQQQRKESQSESDDFLQQLRLGLFSTEETT